MTTGNIAWKALGDITILISMFSMWIVLLIDSLLKISATSAELEFDGFSGNGQDPGWKNIGLPSLINF